MKPYLQYKKNPTRKFAHMEILLGQHCFVGGIFMYSLAVQTTGNVFWT